MIESVFYNFVPKNSSKVYVSKYLATAAPFAINRFLVSYSYNEPIGLRVIEGLVFGAVAAINEFLIDMGILSNFALSYLPIVASVSYKHKHTLFPKQLHYPPIPAVLGCVLFKVFYDNEAWSRTVFPIGTYFISGILLGNSKNTPAEGMLKENVLEVSGDGAYFRLVPKLAPKLVQTFLATFSVIEELSLDYRKDYIEFTHPISSAVLCALFTSNVFRQYLSHRDLRYRNGYILGAILGLVLAKYESRIKDSLFPFDIFANTYNTLSRFVVKEKLDLEIEKLLLISANLYISAGLLGNHYMVREQSLINEYFSLAVNQNSLKPEDISTYRVSIIFYIMGTAIPFLLSRILFDAMNAYYAHQFKVTVRDSILDEVLNKRQLLSVATQNKYSVKEYLDDVSNIVDRILVENLNGNDYGIVSDAFYLLPKIALIKYLRKEVFFIFPLLIVTNTAYNRFYQMLTQLKQNHIDLNILSSTKFDNNEKHDIENVDAILQRSGLNFTRSRWHEMQKNIQDNFLKISIYKKILNHLDWIYNFEILYNVLRYGVANLIYYKAISKDGLFLFTVVLKSISDFICFETKHQADIDSIFSSRTRLDFLLQQFGNSKNDEVNSRFNVSYKVASQVMEYGSNHRVSRDYDTANYDDFKHNTSNHNDFGNDYHMRSDDLRDNLKIELLSFKRGKRRYNKNKESLNKDLDNTFTLSIQNITLKRGNIYVLIGDNGGGKSSLLSLLYYIVKEIYDPSYMRVQGSILYPTEDILIIPQKDYCPFNITLFELIMYPIALEALAANEKSLHEEKIISLMQEFQISHDVNFTNKLYETNINWCNALSGGQLKKLFMIKPFIECPGILFLDEVFGPLDAASKKIIATRIKTEPCLIRSIIVAVYHGSELISIGDDKNNKRDMFFDHLLYLKNDSIYVEELGSERKILGDV